MSDVTSLLGGTANPLGAVVQYLRAPVDPILELLTERFRPDPRGAELSVELASLLPFESPWSRVLVAPCGEWTALVNNGLYGGDGTAPGPALSQSLEVACVVACHVPRYGPGHEQTQLEVLGPSGDPPLMYLRSISATATDGRWEWYESGTPFEFEDRERYAAGRKRDRFDRALLLDYLAALGIPAGDDRAYGRATLLEERTVHDRRSVTLAEARADFH